jgi:hypothetical protein
MESYQAAGANAQRMPMMLSACVLTFVAFVVVQTGADISEFPTNHLFYALRFIGALLAATVVPLLIDQRARSSTRVLR